MTEDKLFTEFQKVSAKEWKQKIQVDLKGKDYNETLVWESLEGIKVKPFYHEDDLDSVPGFEIPEKHHWHIAQEILVTDEKNANQKALEVLEKGAESLVFVLQSPTISWDVLFSNIDLEQTPIHLVPQFLDMSTIKSLVDYLDGKERNIHIHIDILGHLARTGTWFIDQKEDHEVLGEIHSLSNSQPKISFLSVDAGLYQNAGANCVQQLAYALAHANEYLNHIASCHPEPFDRLKTGSVEGEAMQSLIITFKVSVGSNYFFEIAKLRALRWLWQSLALEYGIGNDCHILAIPSKRNKSIYDYNVNQLRTTTEVMAAVLGGADTVCNLAYDTLYKEENEFSERIARNQLLVLKNESYFEEKSNAANGSYYIENLTQKLAEKALQVFKQIEAGGGFLAQLKEGTIQRKIKESAKKEQELFNDGKLNLVGTNKYQNLEEKMKTTLDFTPFPKKERRKTIIEPILEKRLAETSEKERLQTE